MKNIFAAISFVLLCNIILCLAFIDPSVAGEKDLIKIGDIFPDIILTAPEEPALRSYLGIGDVDKFTIKDIKADFLLMVVISIDCDSCDAQTPLYNHLFCLLESDPYTKDSIKMIGNAVGNDKKYIKEYTEKNQVPYPVIEDPEYSIYDAIGPCPTPFTMFIMNSTTSENKAVVLDSFLGINYWYEDMFEHFRKFLKDINNEDLTN